MLDEPEATELQPGNPRSQRTSSSDYKILIDRAGLARSRAENLDSWTAAGLKSEPVA
jgi:hypothetical protein